MILKKTSSVNCEASTSQNQLNAFSQQELINSINRIAQCQDEDVSFNNDGTLNLNGLSMKCINSILLETEKMGLSYSIEKSTVINIKEAS